MMNSVRDLFVPGQCVLIEWLDSLRNRDELWQAPIAAARRKRMEGATTSKREEPDSNQKETALSTERMGKVPEEVTSQKNGLFFFGRGRGKTPHITSPSSSKYKW